MTDLIDAEIAAVKRNGHKENAKKNEVTYFIDHSRSRREDEERARKKAEEERAKRLAAEEERQKAFRRGRENERRVRRSRSPFRGRKFPRRSSRSPARYPRRPSPNNRRRSSRSPSPRRRPDRGPYGRKRFSRSPPRRRDEPVPANRRRSGSRNRDHESSLDKGEKLKMTETKEAPAAKDKGKEDTSLSTVKEEAGKLNVKPEKDTVVTKSVEKDAEHLDASGSSIESTSNAVTSKQQESSIPLEKEPPENKRAEAEKIRSKSRESKKRSISPKYPRRRSRSFDRRPRRGSRNSRDRSRSRRSRDRKRSRSRRSGNRRSRSRRSGNRRRSRSRDVARSRRVERKRRRSRSSSSSSTSSSSSSSSAKSSSSTALIQQILAQNAKGALAVQQHKNSQRNKKDAETAELLKAQAIALSQGALALSNSPMEVVKRQLYIGGLPIGIQPSALVDFLNEAMVQRKLSTSAGSPVLRANLNGDGSFGFVTLRSIEETDAALLHLNGIQCLGQSLKLGRPKNYEGSGPSTDILGVPLQPLNFASNDAQTLLMHLEKRLQETYKETGVPSPVIKIANMLTTEMVNDQEELDDVYDDVKEECQSYGTVIEVRLPKRGEINNLFVFVHMATKAEAQVACDKLSGRSFDGRALKVTFCPLAEFLGEEQTDAPKAQEKEEPNFIAGDID